MLYVTYPITPLPLPVCITHLHITHSVSPQSRFNTHSVRFIPVPLIESAAPDIASTDDRRARNTQ